MYFYIGYIFVALLGGLGMARRGGRAHPFLWFFFFATLFVFGFRYGIGTDYHNYINMYEDIGLGRGHHQGRVEFGFFWMNRLLTCFDFPAQIVIFFSFLLTFALILYSLIKYSENYFVSILVLVCFGLLFQTTNLVRQALAFSVCLLAIPYVLRRDFLRFMLVVVLAAFLFHRTALFFVGVYFVATMPRSQLMWGALFVMATIAHLSTQKVITVLVSLLGGLDFVYAGYLRDLHHINRTASGMGINVLLELGIFFFMVANLQRIQESQQNHLFTSVFMLGVLMNFAFAETAMLNRVAFYYHYFSFLALPAALHAIRPGRSRTLVYCLFLAYCLMLYMRAAFSESSPYSAYDNVLWLEPSKATPHVTVSCPIGKLPNF